MREWVYVRVRLTKQKEVAFSYWHRYKKKELRFAFLLNSYSATDDHSNNDEGEREKKHKTREIRNEIKENG